MKEVNFGTLGLSFQQGLIREIIQDKRYGESIIDVIDSKYFDNNSFKFIVENIKEFYGKFERTPDFDEVERLLITETPNETHRKVHLDSLKSVKEVNTNGESIKEQALNFCKQQNLKKELKRVNKIIENAAFEQYKDIEEIIQKALQVGVTTEEAVSVFSNIDVALQENFRIPIPTGIAGIDNLLKGGLGKGELGVVLAPTGVGKTTILTKFANTAYNDGKNVLQIFFEDNVGNIKRKHYTIWSNITPDEQPIKRDEVIRKVKEQQEGKTNELRLLKLPSDGVTVSEIKARIRKLISEGFRPDMIIIDYVDCISPDKGGKDEEWKSEGSIMRSIEAMTSEFDMAIWVATQGNRESIATEIVTTNLMGGSIKKAQIGHVIISIGKTLEQKETNRATITLLKSRIGQDGVIFQNCYFDNEFIEINTDTENTLLGVEEEKVKQKSNRAREIYQITQQNNNNRNI